MITEALKRLRPLLPAALRCGLDAASRVIGRHRRLRLSLSLARKTVSEALEDRLLRLAAEVAFGALLSLPPLLLGLLGLVGYVGPWFGPGAVAQIHHDVLKAAGTVLSPQSVDHVVRPLVDRVLGQGHPDVASVGFLISFWSGSAAMNAYVDGIAVAYDMGGLRPAWRSRLLALGLYVLALVVGTALLPALALGPGVITSLVPGVVTSSVSTLVHALYWPTVGVGTLALLATLFWLAVPVKSPWARGLPGAGLTMAVWLAGSFGIRAYLTSGLRNNATYGPLAAPVAALLFFYVTALAVLVGAELNSELDEMWPHPTTAEGRRRTAEGSDRPDRAQTAGGGSTSD